MAETPSIRKGAQARENERKKLFLESEIRCAIQLSYGPQNQQNHAHRPTDSLRFGSWRELEFTAAALRPSVTIPNILADL
jgi:hypothetical protein